ncbi:MAG: HAD-IA family hydrolase, partial [Chloroflexi bacterium]|nr:HAD-IA family hydrolase [Chloroflexota bacterium]
MIALARRLRKSYRTALLSNATLYLDTLLVDHDLAGVFDVIVNSARVGLRKPDPQIYRLTLDRLRLVPAQCLFIDDKERNTLVAQSLGMRVIVFRSVADLMRRLRAAGGCV